MEFINIIEYDFTNIIQNLMSLYFKRDYETLCNILKIEHDCNCKYGVLNKSDSPIVKYEQQNQEMIFYDDENFPVVMRPFVDEESRQLINTLLMVTSNSIPENKLIDSILEKWLINVHIIGPIDYEIVPKIIGKETRMYFNASKKVRDNFSRACKNKGISPKAGFKMALLSYYIEIFEEMCKTSLNNMNLN